jgi:hypothetical protein
VEHLANRNIANFSCALLSAGQHCRAVRVSQHSSVGCGDILCGCAEHICELNRMEQQSLLQLPSRFGFGRVRNWFYAEPDHKSMRKVQFLHRHSLELLAVQPIQPPLHSVHRLFIFSRI